MTFNKQVYGKRLIFAAPTLPTVERSSKFLLQFVFTL
jgi:hypothetical protein